MKENKNVPEIRFEGFTGEWEEARLGELADIFDGTHQTPNYQNEGVKFVSVENINSLKTNKYISYQWCCIKKEKVVQKYGRIKLSRIRGNFEGVNLKK